MESVHLAGAAEIAGRPVTCERCWFNRCRTQLTALMPGGTLLQEFIVSYRRGRDWTLLAMEPSK